MLKSFAAGSMFGEQRGERPIVLALHGWGRSHVDFDEVLEWTAGIGSQSFESLALDLPGFGASPPPATAFGTADYARALEPVLDTLGPRPVIVGHSFGALVALRLGRARPDRIGALVLTGAPLFRATSGRGRVRFGYRFAKALARTHLRSEASLERARQRYGSRDYVQSSGVMREVLVRRLAEDYEADLRALAVPLTLVCGARDTAAPVEVGRRAADIVADAQLVVLPGIGHLVPTEAPNELRRAILERLA